MANNEEKALQLMAEAEKKLTTQRGFFGSLFGCVFILFLHAKFTNEIAIDLAKLDFI